MSAAERLLRPLEATVNRLLALDPETPARLRPLTGRSVLVELPEAGLSLRADFNAQGLSLSQVGEEQPAADASVRLPAKAALALARSRGERAQGVEFRGDVAVVHALRRLAGGLEIDWEEQLARLTGDTIAHHVGLAVGGVLSWLGQSRRTFEANAGEYLTEEARQLPPKLEVAAFLDDVDRLRQDSDRLQARLERLERDHRLH
jgi:ubiquinone biosynthesis protein UbiJ